MCYLIRADLPYVLLKQFRFFLAVVRYRKNKKEQKNKIENMNTFDGYVGMIELD